MTENLNIKLKQELDKSTNYKKVSILTIEVLHTCCIDASHSGVHAKSTITRNLKIECHILQFHHDTNFTKRDFSLIRYSPTQNAE